ncbi:MAG: hypothetical protein HC901_03095 [Bdellovibrionaceae bacterium]|nr:hypothetical protein [Pseudobdellovibrionaceae bacterium]
MTRINQSKLYDVKNPPLLIFGFILFLAASLQADDDLTLVGNNTAGQVLWEKWNGTDRFVERLINSANFDTTPTNSTWLSSLQSPVNTGDWFGTRLRGYIIAPQTGTYRFYISSDDNSDLWLSSNASAFAAQRIALNPGWSSLNNWTVHSQQASGNISLTAGEKYYFEAYQCDGTGGDHVSVGWSINNAAITVVPGNAIISYGGDPDDTDGDDLPDSWEQSIIDSDPGDSLDSFDDITPLGNLDGDSFTNRAEYYYNLDPLASGDLWTHWNFDNNGNNTTSFHWYCTLNWGASWNTAGISGNAVYLDGINDSVGIRPNGIDPTIAYLGFTRKTIALWCYPNTANQTGTLWDEGGNQTGLCIQYVNGTVQAGVAQSGIVTAVASTVPAATWSHVTVIINNGTLSLSINGNTPVNATCHATSVAQHANNGAIGQTHTNSVFRNSTGNFFSGKIDDFRVYDGIPTSQTLEEIQDLDVDELPDWWEWLIVSANSTDSITTPADVLPGDDFDDDGMGNQFEFEYGFDPIIDDGDLDADGDGLSNADEAKYGTDPLSQQDPGTYGNRAVRLIYDNITGTNVSSLTSHIHYPYVPDRRFILEYLSDNATRGDNYGSRLEGWLVAPQSASYRFWVAGDDQIKFFLSSNESGSNLPANATASIPDGGWTNENEWTKYSSQNSTWVSLTKGQRYFYRVLHKEGTGGDHLNVAWEIGSTVPRETIPGAFLEPYDTDGDGLTDTEETGLETDPLVTDTDGDGMPDGWEWQNYGNPLVSDPDVDSDTNGIPNLRQYVIDSDLIGHWPFEEGSGSTRQTGLSIMSMPP